MRNRSCIIFCGLVLVAASLCGLAAEREWSVYQPGNSACYIKLPANPEYQTNIVDSIATHVYTVKDATKSPPFIYSIGFGDYPKDKITDTDGGKKKLDADRDNFIKAVNGKLLAETALEKDHHPGRAALISAEDGKAHYLLHEFVIENRVFQLVVCVPAATEDDPDVAKFFDSFQLPRK